MPVSLLVDLAQLGLDQTHQLGPPAGLGPPQGFEEGRGHQAFESARGGQGTGQFQLRAGHLARLAGLLEVPQRLAQQSFGFVKLLTAAGEDGLDHFDLGLALGEVGLGEQLLARVDDYGKACVDVRRGARRNLRGRRPRHRPRPGGRRGPGAC